MTRLHLPLLSFLLVFHTATPLKLFNLFNPYLISAQSETQADKQEISEELPVYRDLPPIKKEVKDLTEALEATRNLKFTRPPLDIDAFYASLRKAADDARNVIGDGSPFSDIQTKKTDKIVTAEKAEDIKETVTSKSSNEAFLAKAKAPATNLQVKRSENSFVPYTGGETAALQKAGSDVAVSVQAPFTNVQVRKQLAVQAEPGLSVYPKPPQSEPSGAEVGVHVEAPFTNVHVRKEPGSVYSEPASGAGVYVDAPFTSVKVHKGPGIEYSGPALGAGVSVEAPFTSVKVHKEPGIVYSGPASGAGVHVEAPFTSVKVQKGTGYGYPGLGTQVGVNVDVPFPSIKVKKVVGEVPAGPPTDSDASGGGIYHEGGVSVNVPFVKVKVGAPAVAKGVPAVVDEEQEPLKPLVGVGGFLLPKRPGKPLDLDINIPGIFNLRLLRDQAGRGRLGIGVLPIFSSWANPQQPHNSYPPPTTA